MGVTALAYNARSNDLWVILANFPRKMGLPCKVARSNDQYLHFLIKTPRENTTYLGLDPDAV